MDRGCATNGIGHLIPYTNVHGVNMGPSWGRQDPGKPHVGPMNFAIWDDITNVRLSSNNSTGVGVTKPISSVPLITRFFTIVKTLVTYWTSCSYLTGVAAAQLRWHLSNMNVMQMI